MSRSSNGMLDQFLGQGGEKLSTDPLKRVLLQHDLWTLFDFLMVRHIARRGDLETRHRRDELCRKLACAIQSLALPTETLAKLPDNYSHGHSIRAVSPRRTTLIRSAITSRRASCRATTSGKNWTSTRRSVRKMSSDAMCSCTCGPSRDVLTSASFVVSQKGDRSSRITCESSMPRGIDWRASAQHGSIALTPDAPKLPAGTEVALLQFLIALDTNLQLVPTPLVESVRSADFQEHRRNR